MAESSNGWKPKMGTPVDETRRALQARVKSWQNSQRKFEYERSSMHDLRKLEIMRMSLKGRKDKDQGNDDFNFLFTGTLSQRHLTLKDSTG